MPGFPLEMVSLVRCTHDDAELTLDPDHLATPDGAILKGRLRCRHCRAHFHIDHGILNLLDSAAMDAESLHEQKSRNANGFTVDELATPLMRANNEMEMLPTLEALPVEAHHTILELGCGEGRYTLPLVAKARRILAIDFSIELLTILRSRLPADANVGLVLGDISTVKVAPASFDFALSTLTSNLPTRGHRDSLYALARHALTGAGRFVFSTHHHGFRQILAGQEKSGRYRTGGIYRYNFRLRECLEEPAPYFERVQAHPIQIHLPFARRLKLPIVRLSRMMERVPVLNRFGMLVLCVAEQPRKLARRVARSKTYATLVCSLSMFQAEFEVCCEIL